MNWVILVGDKLVFGPYDNYGKALDGARRILERNGWTQEAEFAVQPEGGRAWNNEYGTNYLAVLPLKESQ